MKVKIPDELFDRVKFGCKQHARASLRSHGWQSVDGDIFWHKGKPQLAAEIVEEAKCQYKVIIWRNA